MELSIQTALFVAVGFIVVSAVVGLLIRSKGTTDDTTDTQYQPIKRLLTPAERSFYGVLSTCLKDDYLIFCKVRIADVIKPVSGLNRSEWQRAFNKISSKHLDFVICDKKDLSILCAVELNDSSHEKATRAKRDAFVSKSLESAGVSFTEFSAKKSYSISDVSERLSTYLKDADKSVKKSEMDSVADDCAL
ncbi:DUF2726 domain-containing protein [Photobacterium ganghwense]|uniref:DUF2726 domain-containing protein n=1 Tax=Photobacterium ganghwense TaxID=320778 RepID=UPI001A8E6615|nr:DUF2726 domain-containing protein [Photobacterium ganghwense]QSV15467.1 DUF2726 domain-containing protein [Photobacterium ganghwense]QSV17340.1 DUF2726 domain-containing protein [Photobacterium ganghwense]